jgi:catechol 2,3-dioxygenase-like lactoylglutathione lyase family enzyme
LPASTTAIRQLSTLPPSDVRIRRWTIDRPCIRNRRVVGASPVRVGALIRDLANRRRNVLRAGLTVSAPATYGRVVSEPAARSAARMLSLAPTFPVSDVAASLAHYGRLGFTTSEYTGESAAGGYGFARRDTVELQLGAVPEDRSLSAATAYLYVNDADALAVEWRDAGADVRFPEDTPWGKREGVMIDPDGNIIRFGSPL